MTGDPAPTPASLVVNGWSIYGHPLFLDQFEGLTLEVEARKVRDPKTWRNKNCTKRLAGLFKLVTEAIPADPGAATFRQGGTLGDHRKHWFRAKFFQQYQLFYRFNSGAKVIVIAWALPEQKQPGLCGARAGAIRWSPPFACHRAHGGKGYSDRIQIRVTIQSRRPMPISAVAIPY
ncbi:type II toxin-antitoxin system YhaV family toxin [Tritonibacter horizontis]|uniref:Toxin YhaV n=1 Tax=Tritonibacter horizontis TaxID=1768241 RepID=A0A132C237_9RHOB|nr:type II toxin-antitoxin system YhaV family toxin [Tritonibacter horizontis]KUP94649.1 toxin YhaV [Tritonibacter horizontis]